MLHFSEPPELSVKETAELYTRLKENTVHLKTIEAGSPFDDMQPLRAVMAGVAKQKYLGMELDLYSRVARGS